MTKQVTVDIYPNLPSFNEFITRINEHHCHNIIHHPDEDTTLNVAFHEVLTDMIDEVIDIQEREAKDGLPDCVST